MNILDKMKADWKAANDAYHNGRRSKLSDAEFDKLEAAIRRKDPTWAELAKTGAKVKGGKKTKVELVEYMPSLEKFYPEGADKRGRCATEIIMNKADGSSIQVVYKNGSPTQVATRGDGVTGQDISFLIPHLKLPKSIPVKGTVVLRCEALMKTSVFDSWYSKKYDNPRNLVAGVLNRKSDGIDGERKKERGKEREQGCDEDQPCDRRHQLCRELRVGAKLR